MSTRIGIDLGGTKVLGAVVDNGTVVRRHKIATPTEGPEAVMRAIADVITALDAPGLPVGVGVPGPVADGVILQAPNLNGFDEPIDLRAELERVLGVGVTLGNDANAGTLGEQQHGAAAGRQNVLGCWLGTGIGGGLVLDGRLYIGAGGSAAELGHVPVPMPIPRTCGCGLVGCIEAYAGRASMERQVADALAAGTDTALEEIRLAKGKDRLTSGVWKSALKADDPLAHRIINEAIEALAVGIAGIMTMLDLDTVVFGGGLAEKLGQPHIDRIMTAARPHLLNPDVERTWILGTLGDDAGVVGASALATHPARD